MSTARVTHPPRRALRGLADRLPPAPMPPAPQPMLCTLLAEPFNHPFGYYSDDGKRLIYAGKVGTGYTKDLLLDLRGRLGKLEQPTSPFDEGDPPDGAQVHWVQPRLVAEVAFSEWTQNGRLRQPRFEGVRTDKRPRECRRERPAQQGERRT